VYRVVVERNAEKDLDRLDAVIRRRVITAIRALSDQPRPPGCRKLVGGTDDWRIRVGDYRILYEITEIADAIRVVRVYRVRHRREVYD
jgi:mRNA interferase RelE/StbE